MSWPARIVFWGVVSAFILAISGCAARKPLKHLPDVNYRTAIHPQDCHKNLDGTYSCKHCTLDPQTVPAK